MRKILLSALFFLSGMTIQAQTSAEAICGMCPTMPSDHDIAVYMVTGENASVKKYFQQLGEANSKTNKAVLQEYGKVDYAQEEAKMLKKQQEIMNKQSKRIDAGQRMAQFMATLTPEQIKKLESFRKEEDGMKYLASIGKLEELQKLMQGVEDAGVDQPVNQSDLDLMRKDLTAEIAAANTPIFELREKLNRLNDGLEDKASAVESQSHLDHSDGAGKGGAWDQDAVNKDMIAFWEGHVKERKKVLVDYMQAIRNAIPVAKMRDKQQNAQRRMTGQSPLTALESAEWSRAIEYLKAAEDIFPGKGRSSEVQEMMEDSTQTINSNK